jgi:branched-chain amino acid transport system substrate-binding protein
MNVRRLAILHINNDYGVGAAGATKKAFIQDGGSIVVEESLDPGQGDFRTALLKVSRAKPDALYLAVYLSDGALILRQACQMNVTTPIVASPLSSAVKTSLISLAIQPKDSMSFRRPSMQVVR